MRLVACGRFILRACRFVFELALPCQMSALPPLFAEISPEHAAAAPPQNPDLLPATPQHEPGKRGPKTKADKAVRTTYAITGFFAATSPHLTEAPAPSVQLSAHGN